MAILSFDSIALTKKTKASPTREDAFVSKNIDTLNGDVAVWRVVSVARARQPAAGVEPLRGEP